MAVKFDYSGLVHWRIRRDAERALERVQGFYKVDPPEFKVTFCDSKEEVKKKSKHKYSFAFAVAKKDKEIFMKHPKHWSGPNDWKRKDLENLLTHEMSHIFWYSIVRTAKPTWLNEGIARNLEGYKPMHIKEFFQFYKQGYSMMDYRGTVKKYETDTYTRYDLWSSVTTHLLRQHGADHIREFIVDFGKSPKRRDYDRLVKEYFGHSPKALFNKLRSEYLKIKIQEFEKIS